MEHFAGSTSLTSEAPRPHHPRGGTAFEHVQKRTVVPRVRAAQWGAVIFKAGLLGDLSQAEHSFPLSIPVTCCVGKLHPHLGACLGSSAKVRSHLARDRHLAAVAISLGHMTPSTTASGNEIIAPNRVGCCSEGGALFRATPLTPPSNACVARIREKHSQNGPKCCFVRIGRK
ncbi:hypothetical protein SKAU_G00073330 [Synaphobranchus kaupii]|uniref:Uncharacterized protein n=1 Tax=Synaphobranchus kaupii TaxID=118154 RepID=A0A9Q1G825_SYNKA|nr:hypothetical protein SKAU_G00073330 [Synaphobranchus kaupii]